MALAQRIHTSGMQAGVRRAPGPVKANRRVVAVQAQQAVQYPYVTPREARSLWSDRNYAFWDLRTPEEHQTGAKRWMTNVPFAFMTSTGPKLNKDFKPEFEKTFPNKAAKVILACDDGERSEMAYEMLAPLGYTMVKIVEGGLNEYLRVDRLDPRRDIVKRK